jgi:hypothetical protein
MTDERLKQFETAKKLNEEFEPVLTRKQLHFRGNIGSFSLISLKRDTPEQGKGGLVDCGQGRACLSKIDDLLADKIKKIAGQKSRPTREKELQAWIINYAIKNGHALPFSKGLQFLTSELAFRTPEKIVNDILAIDREGALVVIELKSARHKRELEEQADKFRKVIESEHDFFYGLVSLLSPERRWNGKVRKMIVWPDADGRTRMDLAADIEEVRYKEKRGNDGRPEIDYDENGDIVFL